MPVFSDFYLKFPTQLQIKMGDYWVVSYSIATCLHPLAICMDDSSTDWIIHIGYNQHLCLPLSTSLSVPDFEQQ